MQKRSIGNYAIKRVPISLDPKFPISKPGIYHHPSRRITFLHIHDNLEIGYCYKGSGIFVVEDKVMPYKAGDAVVIGDSEMHLATSSPGTISDWVFLALDPAKLISAPTMDGGIFQMARLAGEKFKNIFTPKKNPEIVEPIRQIVEELSAQKAGYKSAVRGLAWTLMARLSRIASQKISRNAGIKKRDSIERISPALAHMAANYAQRLSVPELAAICNASEPNFRRMFIRATGTLPVEYLTRLRLRVAAEELRSSRKKILQVAEESGFTTLSSFNRYFRRHFRTSPRAWRKKS